ncbi:MAG: hypothetical protein UU85_C0002G0014 [Candidatus Wolfebacteria bacterium GW2011_GWA2_42_10]|uniref:Uncharacterized protein n=2 Tax=Candidatus Wolfeibacteriota TaxID=1752735 RepID=A0A0G0XKT1_9BACT|nr:MAG: hypothetical protein UU38_C0003G0013 [Candidatus Wolfebacteria bacterium GW2011_GWB1_41_12]KKS25520.1 MAG: hypothetical protein UU85_C0002G0014 [Candidatus Wolfebacteria bacterium GW2011_GWA2_42_10]KKT56594.1 MAG: hypothetical protein UW50_C0001G0162 [Candidatus Wolfebacteria bacterium GW2011_GWA1_44_24]
MFSRLPLSANISANETEVDRSIVKIAGLAFFGAVSSASFGYFLKTLLIHGDFNSLLFSGLFFSIFSAILLLQSLFVKNLKISALIVLLECLGLSAAYYDKIIFSLSSGSGGGNPSLYVAMAFVFAILFWAVRRGQKELENMLKVNFWRFGKVILPKAIAALFLFASVVFVYGASDRQEFFISRTTFERVLFPNAALVQKFFPEFDISLSSGELISNLAAKQVNKIPQFQILPASAKKQLVNQAAEELKNKISDFFGGNINFKEKIGDSIYGLLRNKFAGLPQALQSYVLLAATALLFLAFEGLAFPLRLIISLFAFIIYEILLALGFATVVLEGRSGEIIVLK